MTGKWTIITALAMLLAFGTAGMAEEGQKKDQQKANLETKASQPTVAQLQAQLHRAMAALIETRAQETPDQERIAKLTRRVQSLREQLVARRAEAGFNSACPFGGPGPRLGPGRGPGWGRGAGFGRGYGAGFGWGAGYGRGAGWGAAQGVPGRRFVDRDDDGICDNYERWRQ